MRRKLRGRCQRCSTKKSHFFWRKLNGNAQGFKYVGWNELLEVSARVNVKLSVSIGSFGVNVELKSGMGKQNDAAIEELTNKIKDENNALLRAMTQLQADRLKEDKERNRLLAEQARLTTHLLDLHVRSFDYHKWTQEEAVLRKTQYSVPPNKLVVVVADFSSGSQDEGREVADEIAHHLQELTKYGIDIHVMNGEVRPGVVVRSEEMARDIGRHLASGTDYLVIWGSMSPRTVGRYRPHLTCVRHLKGAQAASFTTSLDLEAEKLPESGKEDQYKRECYERLIGGTCAAIPSLYAGYRISREEVPQLDAFYKYLGEDQATTKEFRTNTQTLATWCRARESMKDVRLRRLDDITPKKPYPATIFNEKDNSLMALITDADGKEMRFKNKDTGKEEIVYIDVLETTVHQFTNFLNMQGGNKEDSGQRWMRIDPDYTDVVDKDGKFYARVDTESKRTNDHRAMINVNWFGARAYCKWAGKALPRAQEWEAAAASTEKGGTYPWGKGSDAAAMYGNIGPEAKHNKRGGEFPRNRSRIGCYDMGGNLAEWCEDWFDEKDQVSKRMVKGGSYLDKELKKGSIDSGRAVDQVTHHPDIGFRGVVRIPCETPPAP